MSGETKAPRSTGDPMKPEGATPRAGAGGRSGVISGAPLTPERATPRTTGSSQENSLQPNFVPRVVTRPSGDSGTRRIPK